MKKTFSLKKSREFQAVFHAKNVAGDGLLTVFARVREPAEGEVRDGAPARLGLSVSKRYGSAVRRVRWKRLVREAFRALRPSLPTGLDFVVCPGRARTSDSLQAYQKSLKKLLPLVAKKSQRGIISRQVVEEE